jgi:RNA polymerase sigma-70 factor (ECF subfamily)
MGTRFATTRWTMVVAANLSGPGAALALDELCQVYWPPLYGYLRGRGHGPEESQDLTQGFFARLLETQSIRSADPSRGRFRSFLLTALKRYVINEHERDVSARRGGGQVHFTLDFDQAERWYARDCCATDTPERVFDRKWAAIALDRAIQRLRDEFDDAGKGAVAQALLPFLTDTGDLPSYRAVAAELQITEGAVKVAVHRLRQRYGAILRLEISETVVGPAEVEAEMRELFRAVST